MMAVQLPKDVEDRLEALARRTGRSKEFYACKALVEMLDELEDVARAEAVYAEGGTPVPLEKLLGEFADELKD